MPDKTPPLAKLTRPRLHGALLRTRLFRRLDQCRRYPIIWVSGTPGAGKTTLVSTYLGARKLADIWFQLDASDVNPTTLFYYLGIVAPRAAAKQHTALPALSRRHSQDDLAVFARLFFRAFFARFTAPAVLVFDNYHELDAGAAVQPLLAAGLAEVPQDINVIVISRAGPPAAFSRLLASERLCRLDASDLRLSLDETRTIALARANLDDGAVRVLHDRTQGWAAGLTLILERLGREVSERDSLPQVPIEHVFDYFAGEVFDRLPAEAADVLLRSACFTRFSARMAEEVSGNPRAARLLEQLFRKHLFIHRGGGAAAMYQYHDLFRAFLNARADASYPAAERKSLALHGATILEASGLVEEAFDLYAIAGAADAAMRLVVAHAAALIGQGRHQTVVDWVGRIAVEPKDRPPWLDYWFGTAQWPLDPAKGRARLEHAFSCFTATGDARGQLLAAAGIIDSYFFENLRFHEMDHWIEVLQRYLGGAASALDPQSQLRVYCSGVLAALYRLPSHPTLPAFVARVEELIEQPLDVNTRVTAALALLSFSAYSGQFQMAERLVPHIAPLVRSEEVSPLNQYCWMEWLGYYLVIRGEYARARAAFDDMDRLAECHRLQYLATNALLNRMIAAFCEQDIHTGRLVLTRLDVAVNRLRSQDIGMVNAARTWGALLAREPETAAAYAQRALADTEDFGNEMLTIFWRIPLALSLLEMRKFETALEVCTQIRTRTEGSCLPRPLLHTLALGSAALFALGRRDEAADALGRMLTMARSFGLGGDLGRLRTIMPDLCCEALRVGLESEFVRELIRRFSWPAPSVDADEWPWPVRITTLGRFVVIKEGAALVFSRKTQKRPLALLKCIVACGGRDVDIGLLGDLLWPDSEGDAAESTVETALLRLRRLLGRDDAITRRDGRLSINERVCWVDVWSFQKHADELENPSRDEILDQRDPQEKTGAVLALYNGPFLVRDTAEPCVRSMQVRMQARFRRGILSAAARLERSQRWEQAIAVYETALQRDEGAAELCERLAFCRQQRSSQDSVYSIAPRGMSPSASTIGTGASIASAPPHPDAPLRSRQ